MEETRTILLKPVNFEGNKTDKVFAFDRSYWTAGEPYEPNYASQTIIFNDIGVNLLNHAFEGYNTCIFACKLYNFILDGQTGSGKSYTMVIIQLKFLDGIWKR